MKMVGTSPEAYLLVISWEGESPTVTETSTSTPVISLYSAASSSHCVWISLLVFSTVIFTPSVDVAAEAAELPSSAAAAAVLSPAAPVCDVEAPLPPHPASTVAIMATERTALSNFFFIFIPP